MIRLLARHVRRCAMGSTIVLLSCAAPLMSANAQEWMIREAARNGTSSAAVRQAADDLLRRNTLDALLATAEPDAEWIEEAKQAVAQWLALKRSGHVLEWPDVRASWQSTVDLHRKVKAPITRQMLGEVMKDGKAEEWYMLLRRIEHDPKKYPVPTLLKLRTAMALIDGEPDKSLIWTHKSFGYDALVELLAEENPTGVLEQAIFREYVEPLLNSSGEHIDSMRTKINRHIGGTEAKGVSPWMSNMMWGVYHVNAAWVARTAAEAREVREDQWKAFDEHLSKAVEHLLAAHELHPDRPEAAAWMIVVTMPTRNEKRGGRNDREWFAEAIRAEFDHPMAYRQMRLALSPRWGGSFEELIKFGSECAATDRFDTKVPFEFVEAVEQVCTEVRHYELMRVPEVWATMKSVVTKYLDESHRPDKTLLLHRRLALYGWMNGEFELARSHVEPAGASLVDSWFRAIGTNRAEFNRDLGIE